ncbi:hypothetical protein GIB67_004079 [Kingdonia uniflora]|uniref:Protein kinase domain-containing protein n=1 Tax=Kingdonia uniflora TaxID=39325 RepID=A0A7J7NR38_9MAGN|nr:hypothetical protein GIB67_004079 [Kingdonia uniflora]
MFATLIYAANDTKPGCQSGCGNVTIPYPFGIGDGCYIDKGFEITCTKSFITNFLQPFLVASNLKVYEITLDQVYVQLWGARTCFLNSGETSSIGYNLKGGPFTLSSTNNKLTTVGCDMYAYITDLDTQNRMSGCVSLCQEGNTYETNGSCSGFGCCQTTIPSGMKAFNITMVSINTPNKFWSIAYCSIVMVEQGLEIDTNIVPFKGITNFSKSSGLNWAIGNKTCNNINWRETCGNNSYCIDSPYGQGFRCNCNLGYRGNPYLPKGCQGAVGGVGVFLVLALVFQIHRKLKKRKKLMLKKKFFKRNGGLLLEQQISSGGRNAEKSRIFVTQELEKATNNFNESRVLGKGGHGTVYKGMLSNGRVVAIKKSKIVDESQIGQFINELVILSQINHRHVVRLLGYCLETEVPLLVYEFVSNGTLSKHLHVKDHISSISWRDRLRIMKEVAGALSYLHSSASTPIFHRDIKSSNILLDENYRAKVSDFGISRSVSYEQTHLTTLVQGTFGYLDPGYFHSGQFTEKSDVYSFGIVVVELLTGQKPVSVTRSEEEANLAMHYISSVKEDRVFEVLETRVANEARKEEIQVVARLAKKCLKLVGKKRPTMKEVVTQLENLREL